MVKPAEAPDSPHTQRRVLLVTGLSGSGRSTALRALEDMGYEAIDNLPLTLLPDALGLGRAGGPDRGPQGRPVAIGLDTRTRGFDPITFAHQVDGLKASPELKAEVLFFDSDDDVIGRRYTETRRRHPLTHDRPLADAIGEERILLRPVRNLADFVFDTSALSLNDTRRLIAGNFTLEENPGLDLAVTSFSYRKGLPRESDLVFDVRFLANPHYVDGLRDSSGLDDPVRSYIAADPAFPPFFNGVGALLLSLLPHYRAEGKSYLTVAVGCTGGRHRSVFVAEKLGILLRDEGYHATVLHRDMSGERP
jgi:RNase adapter protein RapZ